MMSAERPSDAIDAHVHVWTDDFARYPLAAGYKPSDMARPRFTPSDILGEAAKNGVGRVVLIQMSYYGSDNSYMLDAIAAAPTKFRGIAIIDQRPEDCADRMRQLAKSGVRGFRIIARSRNGWAAAPGLLRMFACGAEENLAICPLIDPEALPDLDSLCSRFPKTPVIVDHLARIGASGPIRPADVDALCALARHPAVMVKVSAFYALGAKRAPYLDLEPLIRRVYDSFGPSRLMWASDCPFQVMEGTYHDSIALVRDRLKFLSDADRRQILRETAEKFFFR
jgi:predicted TIM-barrel fold metal-dependent hydrolase